jgi:hypothetical protein
MDRTMARGDTLSYNAQVFQHPQTGRYVSVDVLAQPPEGYAPANITGFKLWFTAKNNLQDADTQAVSQLSTTTSGITITTPTVGQYSVAMPALATAAFPDGPVALFYDVQLMDGSGNIYTIDGGTLTVSPDVTRALA